MQLKLMLKTQLDSAQKEYNDELNLYNNNSNADIKNAEETLSLAQITLDDKEKYMRRIKPYLTLKQFLRAT